MWKHQKAPYSPIIAAHAAKIAGPLKTFTTWELVDRFSEWLRVLRYSKTAQQSYCQSVSKFCLYIGNKSLVEVTHHDVRSFLVDITRRDISVQCANRFLNGLRSFFDFLYLGGIVDTVAPRFIRGRRYIGPLPKVVPEGNIKKLIPPLRHRATKPLSNLCTPQAAVPPRLPECEWKISTSDAIRSL